jgi:hypothetical protein
VSGSEMPQERPGTALMFLWPLCFATCQEPLQAIGEDKWGKSPGSRV